MFPAGDEYGDLLDLEARHVLPEAYHALIGFLAAAAPPYPRAEMHKVFELRAFEKAVDVYRVTSLLEAAIKQSAAIDLPGIDPFAGDCYASTAVRSGDKQVAGTKNRYGFLEHAFEVNWLPTSSHYVYVRRAEAATEALHELLEALFLYERAIPGCWTVSEPAPVWPGFDDVDIAGYLSPAEVASLKRELDGWHPEGIGDDSIYSLFLDRVRRTAAIGGGLLTIHAGL